MGGGRGIYYSNLDGSNLKSFPRGGAIHIALDVDGGKMYWTVVGGLDENGVVVWGNLDGSNSEIFFEGASPWDIALDLVRGKVYWTDFYFDGILRADLDGQNVEYDYIRSGSPRDIALDLDRGKMYWTNTYWTNPITRTIQRADLDGQNIEHLFDSVDDVKRDLWGPRVGIALDVNGGKMYWTNSGPGTIQRADLNGENREVLFDPILREPHGITLDKDKMYWTDVVKGTIQRADLDGQNIEVLVTGLNRPKDIALLDGDKIYWADEETREYRAEPEETGKIQVADLDGSNVKEILRSCLKILVLV